MKSTLSKDILFNKKLLLNLFLMVMVLCGFLVGKSTFLMSFTGEQQLTLGLLVFAVYLWVAAPIPTGASSILLIALMLVLNLVDNVEGAVAGFLSPALYFILIVSILSQALVKVGIDKVIAQFLIKISKSGPRYIIIGLPIFILILPILLPSAVARFKMLYPLINSMNQLYGFSEKSIFQKYGIYIIGMMNQNATMVIFTGGGFPILASQLLNDYNVADLGWLDWFLMVAPPLWIGSLFMVLFVWNFLKITMPEEKIVRSNSNEEIELRPRDPLSIKLWVVLLSFLTMIITWIVTDQEQVPLLLPPMLLVAFYSIPKIGLVTNKVIREYDWENFLLLGASFSLGILLSENGTAEVLADVLIGVIPGDISIVSKVIIIAFIVFLLRFFFIVPSSAVIVIFPIVMSYSELIGIPPMQLAFLVILVIGSMMILPIHSTTTYLAYETGVFSKKDQYVIGLVSSVTFMFIAIFAALYFW
ncbi:SLC13 family permease [Virgibacillus natechei]|nr:SLC13 family permease [Virgibacillus natechei]UZD12026.1 SLC13 family permease [Virgibacillus natechei]